MFSIRIILFSVFSLLAFGCAVGPKYVRPTVQIPAAYKETGDWKIANPQDGIIRGAWWKIFNDPRLDALEEQVNISNQNIAQAVAQYQEARAALKLPGQVFSRR